MADLADYIIYRVGSGDGYYVHPGGPNGGDKHPDDRVRTVQSVALVERAASAPDAVEIYLSYPGAGTGEFAAVEVEHVDTFISAEEVDHSA